MSSATSQVQLLEQADTALAGLTAQLHATLQDREELVRRCTELEGRLAAAEARNAGNRASVDALTADSRPSRTEAACWRCVAEEQLRRGAELALEQAADDLAVERRLCLAAREDRAMLVAALRKCKAETDARLAKLHGAMHAALLVLWTIDPAPQGRIASLGEATTTARLCDDLSDPHDGPFAAQLRLVREQQQLPEATAVALLAWAHAHQACCPLVSSAHASRPAGQPEGRHWQRDSEWPAIERRPLTDTDRPGEPDSEDHSEVANGALTAAERDAPSIDPARSARADSQSVQQPVAPVQATAALAGATAGAAEAAHLAATIRCRPSTPTRSPRADSVSQSSITDGSAAASGEREDGLPPSLGAHDRRMTALPIPRSSSSSAAPSTSAVNHDGSSDTSSGTGSARRTAVLPVPVELLRKLLKPQSWRAHAMPSDGSLTNDASAGGAVSHTHAGVDGDVLASAAHRATSAATTGSTSDPRQLPALAAAASPQSIDSAGAAGSTRIASCPDSPRGPGYVARQIREADLRLWQLQRDRHGDSSRGASAAGSVFGPVAPLHSWSSSLRPPPPHWRTMTPLSSWRGHGGGSAMAAPAGARAKQSASPARTQSVLSRRRGTSPEAPQFVPPRTLH